MEQEVDDLLLVEGSRLFSGGKTPFYDLGAHPFDVDAAAVVLHLNHDLSALVESSQRHRSHHLLAGQGAFLGRF